MNMIIQLVSQRVSQHQPAAVPLLYFAVSYCYHVQDAFGAQPIGELLAQQGLDMQLQQSLLHGVLLADSSNSGDACSSNGQQLTAAEALERLRLFVQSAGQYGAGTGAQ